MDIYEQSELSARANLGLHQDGYGRGGIACPLSFLRRGQNARRRHTTCQWGLCLSCVLLVWGSLPLMAGPAYQRFPRLQPGVEEKKKSKELQNMNRHSATIGGQERQCSPPA